MGVELSIPIQTRSIRMSVNDVLAKTLADSLNKKFKDTNKVAYFLDGSDTHQQISRNLSQQVVPH